LQIGENGSQNNKNTPWSPNSLDSKGFSLLGKVRPAKSIGMGNNKGNTLSTPLLFRTFPPGKPHKEQQKPGIPNEYRVFHLVGEAGLEPELCKPLCPVDRSQSRPRLPQKPTSHRLRRPKLNSQQ